MGCAGTFVWHDGRTMQALVPLLGGPQWIRSWRAWRWLRRRRQPSDAVCRVAGPATVGRANVGNGASRSHPLSRAGRRARYRTGADGTAAARSGSYHRRRGRDPQLRRRAAPAAGARTARQLAAAQRHHLDRVRLSEHRRNPACHRSNRQPCLRPPRPPRTAGGQVAVPALSQDRGQHRRHPTARCPHRTRRRQHPS